MKKFLLVVSPVLCVVGFFGALWWMTDPGEQPASALGGRDVTVVWGGTEGLSVAEPIQSGNMVVFPVVSDVPRTMDRFVTLDEGLAAGTVQVAETGSVPGAVFAAPRRAGRGNGNPVLGGTPLLSPQPSNLDDDWLDLDIDLDSANVDTLMVRNQSGKPLYLMPGEVVVGGQQDRTVAEPSLLASTGKWQPFDAYCVEHGRWTPRSDEETSTLVASLGEYDPASGDVQEMVDDASNGRFVTSGVALNVPIRRAVQEGRGQDVVWQEVDAQNLAADVARATETQAFSANYASPAVQEALKPYVADLQNAVANTEQVVGVVVAIDGHVVASDVFESTPLFRKLWPKLLKSYALDAHTGRTVVDGSANLNVVDAESFLETAFVGEGRDTGRGRGITLHERRARGVYAYEHHLTENMPGLKARGYGGPVHRGAFE